MTVDEGLGLSRYQERLLGKIEESGFGFANTRLGKFQGIHVSREWEGSKTAMATFRFSSGLKICLSGMPATLGEMVVRGIVLAYLKTRNETETQCNSNESKKVKALASMYFPEDKDNVLFTDLVNKLFLDSVHGDKSSKGD